MSKSMVSPTSKCQLIIYWGSRMQTHRSCWIQPAKDWSCIFIFERAKFNQWDSTFSKEAMNLCRHYHLLDMLSEGNISGFHTGKVRSNVWDTKISSSLYRIQSIQ
jgi:hypothetical protein